MRTDSIRFVSLLHIFLDSRSEDRISPCRNLRSKVFFLRKIKRFDLVIVTHDLVKKEDLLFGQNLDLKSVKVFKKNRTILISMI
jgi:hypothetical protein